MARGKVRLFAVKHKSLFKTLALFKKTQTKVAQRATNTQRLNKVIACYKKIIQSKIHKLQQKWYPSAPKFEENIRRIKDTGDN